MSSRQRDVRSGVIVRALRLNVLEIRVERPEPLAQSDELLEPLGAQRDLSERACRL